jgi:hypothetical protein
MGIPRPSANADQGARQHFPGLDKLLRFVEGLSIMVEEERKEFPNYGC